MQTNLNHMYIDIIAIDLFYQNMGMVFAYVRLRCSWISPLGFI